MSALTCNTELGLRYVYQFRLISSLLFRDRSAGRVGLYCETNTKLYMLAVRLKCPLRCDDHTKKWCKFCFFGPISFRGTSKKSV